MAHPLALPPEDRDKEDTIKMHRFNIIKVKSMVKFTFHLGGVLGFWDFREATEDIFG